MTILSALTIIGDNVLKSRLVAIKSFSRICCMLYSPGTELCVLMEHKVLKLLLFDAIESFSWILFP